jgi:RecA-family ATPase
MTTPINTDSPYHPGVSVRDLWRRRDAVPDQLWIVADLLPVGLTILAAREKTGKSLMCFSSIAIPIAGGCEALGTLPTSKGRVLYFALEEALPTVMGRLDRLYGDGDSEPPEHLHLFLGDTMRMWQDDSIDEIERHIMLHHDVRAVFIDTLRLVIPTRFSGMDAYEFEYKQGARLQTLALKHNVSIVAIHHTTKTEYTDVFDRIGGTAFSKSAETLVVLERDGREMKMHVRGRSLPTTCYQLRQDVATLEWQLQQQVQDQASSRSPRLTRDQASVSDVFAGAKSLKYGQLVDCLRLHGVHESTAGRWLKDRVAEGSLVKLPDRGGYALPPPSSLPIGDSDGGGDNVPLFQEPDVTEEA